MPAALPLQQHPRFGDALARLGRDVCQLDVAHAYPVIAVRVFGQLLASRGPVWRATAGPSVRVTALARSGLRLINADTHDCAAHAAAGFYQLTTAAWVAELDLRGDEAGRIAATQGKWRNQWRRALDAPVICRHERYDRARHQWLLDADRAQQRQKRYRALPHRLIDAFAAQDRDAACVHVAYHDARPVAAMLFLSHCPVVTYHLGWSSAEGRRWGLHHRLLQEAATVFADRGYHRLDMGGVDTDHAPGLARFKIASGAQIRPLGGSWLRIGRARLALHGIRC